LKCRQKKSFVPKGHGLHWSAHPELGAQAAASSSNESESGSCRQKKSFVPKGHGLHWSVHPELGAQAAASSSNESESGSVIVNGRTAAPDEAGSSSPSSSGIVADINDSNGESNQRTSATSSSLSSCEPLSELMESSYDTPRPGRTFRSRAEDAAAVNQDYYQHHLSFGVPSGTGAIAQRAQLGQIREPGRLMMPTLEEKAEPSSSTSVLQNVFNGLSGSSSSTNSAPLVASASSSTINDDEETKFNHSFSSDNGRGFGTRNFTVPKQATAYASNKYSSDNSFRYGGSVAPELSTRYRSLESGVCSLVGDENTTTRKQTICSKLTEKYRLIDIAVKKLDEVCYAPAECQL
uniref:Serine-rich adhesin for platelets-like n=1 Tax=Gongylonema pulchrum TaxID=637853 RepID=A0A183E7J3_9BILA